MLSIAELLDAVMLSCQSALPTGTALLKPGTPTGSSLSPEWLEFWVDRIGAPTARRNSPSTVEVSLTVNCFGRPPANPGSVQSLADATRLHLTRRNVPVLREATPIGFITLREAEMRDLSRPATQKSAGLHQWSVTVRGTLHPQ